MKINRTAIFFITWSAVLVVGDGLCWGTADYFWVHNQNILGDVFFFLLWVISIVSVSNMVIEKWERPRTVWTSSTLVMVIIGVFIMYNSGRFSASTIEPGHTEAVQSDYIPGTKFTHAEIKQDFPFGYIVCYATENQRYRYEVFKTGLTEWTFDVDKVSISPDFSKGKVVFDIPNVYTKPGDKGPRVIIRGERLVVTVAMQAGFAAPAGFNFGNQPVPYVGTLSVDQRSPVFVIGFRIPTAGELQQPRQATN